MRGTVDVQTQTPSLNLQVSLSIPIVVSVLLPALNLHAFKIVLHF